MSDYLLKMNNSNANFKKLRQWAALFAKSTNNKPKRLKSESLNCLLKMNI